MAEIIKINENTWRMEDDGVRFYLFCGKDKAALIDSGMNTPDAKEIAESLTGLPIILINTHADRDHISGNSAFSEFYMSPDEEGNLINHGGKGKILPVKEGDVIDLGGRPLKIIDIPGHTPGSIAILDIKNRVLISGDSLQNGHIFMFGPHRNLDTFITSLHHLKEYENEYDGIYPMHGDFPVKPDLVDKLIEGANEIKSGEASAEEVEVFGNKVHLFKFKYGMFLCE